MLKGGETVENELAIDVQQIVVVPGSIVFQEYEQIKMQAVALAEEIEAVEVNEDNIKTSKKLLAAINKDLKQLEDNRISIKKVMLQPYEVFESQVKEIVNIVKTADNEVRKQVKYLEEFERLQKEDEIKALFEKRKKQYKKLNDLVQFNQFLQSKHLNKTTSIAAVEKEMVEWFEKINNDIKVIQTMTDASELLSVYIESFDFTKAISQVNERERLRRQAEASKALHCVLHERTFHITVYDEKDFTLLKMFMNQNEIKFDTKEGF